MVRATLRFAITLVAALIGAAPAWAAPFPTAFTYQGSLVDNGVAANGSYDLQFTPYADAGGGGPLAAPWVAQDVMVEDGLFSTSVDFGAAFFVGDALFLEIAVRPGASTGAFQALAPRQPITPVPYALKVRVGSVGAAELGANAVGSVNLAANAVGAAQLADNAVDNAALGDAVVGASELADTSVSTAKLQDLAVSTAKLQDLAVTTPKLAAGAVTAAKIAPGAIGASQVDLAQIQRALTASCPNDMPLLGIRSDGAPSCGNIFKPLGGGTGVADGVDAAFDGAGNPVLAYYDLSDSKLHLVLCRTPTCNGASDLAWAGSGTFGQYPSVAIGASGALTVAFYNATNGDLLRGTCTLPACSPFNTLLDTANDVGKFASLALRANGTAVVAYYDATALDLKLHDGATARLLDSTGDVGQYAALAIRPDGRPIVAYYDATAANLNLKLFDCVDANCTSGTARLLDAMGDVGENASIAMRRDGRAVIAYADDTNDTVKLYDCADVACSSGTARTLGPSRSASNTTIAVRADDRAVVAYQDAALAVRIHACDDVACTTGTARAPAGAAVANAGQVQLLLRSDARPLLAYRPNYFGDLSVLICGNADCSSPP